MIDASDLRRLAAAGLNTEQIALVMELMERDTRALVEADEARKAKGRDRWHKWREGRAANVSPTDRNVSQQLVSKRAPVEDKPLPKIIEPKEVRKKETRSADADAFKAELSDLDPEHLTSLLEHRKRKRAAITGKAARMFRDDAAKCGLSLPEAVDICIRRNWIAIEPGWLPGVREGPAAKAAIPTESQLFAALARKAADDHQRTDDFGSSRPAIPHLSVVNAR